VIKVSFRQDSQEKIAGSEKLFFDSLAPLYYTINVAEADATSEGLTVTGRRTYTVETLSSPLLTGCTIKLQGSVSGANWVDILTLVPNTIQSTTTTSAYRQVRFLATGFAAGSGAVIHLVVTQ